MNFFFLLRHPSLEASVTLCNYLCADSVDGVPGDQTAYLAWSDGSAWQIRPFCELSRGESRTISASELPPEADGQSIVFFFLSDDRYPTTMATLPIVERFETSPVWRANIALRSPFTSASYQGDYPPRQAARPGGTMLSICPLVQDQDGLLTEFLFVNISADPAFGRHTLRFHYVEDGAVLTETEVRNNHVNRVPLPPAGGKLLIAACTGMSGIPIYLTHDATFREMSLEHSLAPLDLMHFDDKLHLQRSMKSNWFERLAP